MNSCKVITIKMLISACQKHPKAFEAFDASKIHFFCEKRFLTYWYVCSRKPGCFLFKTMFARSRKHFLFSITSVTF